MDPNIFSDLINNIKENDFDKFCENLNQATRQDQSNVNFQNPASNQNTLLHYCIEYSNYPALVQTLSKKPNVNVKNSSGIAPIHLAIWKGFLPLAATLLQCGADPNIEDKQHRTPLFFAIARSDIRAVRLLLTFNANPDVHIGEKSLLTIAVQTSFPEAIILLLDEMQGKTDDLSSDSYHPLYEAIKIGNRDCFAALLYNHENDILRKFNQQSLIEIALETNSTLLPLIVSLTKKEIDRMTRLNLTNIPSFPPKHLKSADKKKIKIAEEFHDTYLPTDYIKEYPKHIKSPWNIIVESSDDDSM